MNKEKAMFIRVPESQVNLLKRSLEKIKTDLTEKVRIGYASKEDVKEVENLLLAIEKPANQKLLDLLQDISYGFDEYVENEFDTCFWGPWSQMQEYLS